jgi:hypothetical protein
LLRFVGQGTGADEWAGFCSVILFVGLTFFAGLTFLQRLFWRHVFSCQRR